jgi:hypothetical protein
MVEPIRDGLGHAAEVHVVPVLIRGPEAFVHTLNLALRSANLSDGKCYAAARVLVSDMPVVWRQPS